MTGAYNLVIFISRINSKQQSIYVLGSNSLGLLSPALNMLSVVLRTTTKSWLNLKPCNSVTLCQLSGMGTKAVPSVFSGDERGTAIEELQGKGWSLLLDRDGE